MKDGVFWLVFGGGLVIVAAVTVLVTMSVSRGINTVRRVANFTPKPSLDLTVKCKKCDTLISLPKMDFGGLAGWQCPNCGEVGSQLSFTEEGGARLDDHRACFTYSEENTCDFCGKLADFTTERNGKNRIDDYTTKKGTFIDHWTWTCRQCLRRSCKECLGKDGDNKFCGCCGALADLVRGIQKILQSSEFESFEDRKEREEREEYERSREYFD